MEIHFGQKATEGVNREFTPIDDCVVALLTGLITDGEGAKQRALEEAFRALIDTTYVDRAKAFFNWKEWQP